MYMHKNNRSINGWKLWLWKNDDKNSSDKNSGRRAFWS